MTNVLTCVTFFRDPVHATSKHTQQHTQKQHTKIDNIRLFHCQREIHDIQMSSSQEQSCTSVLVFHTVQHSNIHFTKLCTKCHTTLSQQQ